MLPDTELNSGTDLLSEASGGTVTEVEVATHGATVGNSVGDDVWTSHKLPPTGWNNIEDMLKRSIDGGVIYGTVSLYSPREQDHNDVRRQRGRGKGLAQRYFDLRAYSIIGGVNDYTRFFPCHT